MIFVTVGTQLAFDRLIEAVDQWAISAPDTEIFAQIGPGEYKPRHFDYAEFIPPEECDRRMREADAIVAHAGMGTIIGALELGKQVLVMPRQAALGEHRNDHQLATATRFEALGRVVVAADEHTLAAALDALELRAMRDPIGPYASERLLGALSGFINR